MSKTPENEIQSFPRELRYQQVQKFAQQSMERAFFNMGMTGVGIAGFFTDMAYVGQKYYPLPLSLQELQQMDPNTLNPQVQEALVASMGMAGFLLFWVVGVAAVGYRVYEYIKFSREADLLSHPDIENKSKRPPTLGS